MEMKKLLESLEECGMGMPPAPMEQHEGNPVSMNVSLNASGKEHVEDLINMMKNAGMGGAKEVGPMDMPAMPVRMDMERLRGIVDGPKPDGDIDFDLDKDGNPDMQLSKKLPAPESIEEGGMSDIAIRIEDWINTYKTHIGNNGDTLPEGFVKYFLDTGIYSDAYDQDETAKAEKVIGKPYTDWDYDDQEKALEMMPVTKEMFDEIEKITGRQGEDAAEMVADIMDNMEEGYDNEPDENYGALDDVIASGDDLHKKKKAYHKAQDGDNAMALEQEILKALKADYASKK